MGDNNKSTPHRSDDAKLAGSDELVRLLLNSTGEGIYGVDMNGNCTFANPACAKLLGFESQAGKEKSNDAIPPPKDMSSQPNEPLLDLADRLEEPHDAVAQPGFRHKTGYCSAPRVNFYPCPRSPFQNC